MLLPVGFILVVDILLIGRNKNEKLLAEMLAELVNVNALVLITNVEFERLPSLIGIGRNCHRLVTCSEISSSELVVHTQFNHLPTQRDKMD